MKFKESGYWALILGGSSGFGLASAHKLSENGMNIIIVHRDRKGSMAKIEEEFQKIRQRGVELASFNLDALSEEGRNSALSEIQAGIGKGKIRTLLHSIAFGNLKPLVPKPGLNVPDEMYLEDEDFSNTIYAMGTSLISWVQGAFAKGLFASDARVLALTSEGNEVAWRSYAAVSAAKCALESVSRSIAFEFAPYGIRSNILQPGVTDTPALRMIPGSDLMKEKMMKRNPFGRLTTPEDVAAVVYLLSLDESSWINGALIRVDGGEKIAG